VKEGLNNQVLAGRRDQEQIDGHTVDPPNQVMFEGLLVDVSVGS